MPSLLMFPSSFLPIPPEGIYWLLVVACCRLSTPEPASCCGHSICLIEPIAPSHHTHSLGGETAGLPISGSAGLCVAGLSLRD